jgi:hypothetical protein
MKGTEASKVFSLFAQHHMFGHHIHNVGPLFDLFNRIGVQPGNLHRESAVSHQRLVISGQLSVGFYFTPVSSGCLE